MQKYRRLALKWHRDEADAAHAAFLAVIASNTRRADDPWAIVTTAVSRTLKAETRADRHLISTERARHPQKLTHEPPVPSGADDVGIANATADAAMTLGGQLVFVWGCARDEPRAAASSARAIARLLLPKTQDGMLQLAVGPAGVHSDSKDSFVLMAEVAAEFGLRRRTQANEQVDVAIALEKYGKRPLALLEEWGWLEAGVTIAHLCDVTEEEIERLAASGVTATHAPGCDLPMGWGIAPVARLRAAGIIVGLGTSGGGSNDASHLLADARLAMQVAPLVGPPLSAREVLGMATEGSAIGLGRPELGNLRPGSAADLCVWDVSGVADAGVADPVAGLLWASPGRRPKHVVVNGEIVVRDYTLVNADEAEIVARLRERVGRSSREMNTLL